MGSYEPECLYGHTYTATASATITAKQLIVVSGSGTVGPAGADSNAVVGVAATDGVTNGPITYFPRGPIHISTASGGITAAARVNSGAVGTVASAAAGVGNVGIALTTALDTADVTWMEC